MTKIKTIKDIQFRIWTWWARYVIGFPLGDEENNSTGHLQWVIYFTSKKAKELFLHKKKYEEYFGDK